MTARAHLPLLKEHRRALENCAYCPKLCRTTCPVSGVEPTDILTPWGKMTLAFDLARSESPPGADEFNPIWGCTGCRACTAACKHENPVDTTLYAARASVVARGGSVPGRGLGAKESSLSSRLSEIDRALGPLRTADDNQASIGLLLGCAYAADSVLATAIVALGRALFGNVRLLSACCGAPFSHLGQAEEASLAAQDLSEKVRGVERLIVADPGCKLTCDTALLPSEPSGKRRPPVAELLLDHALAGIDRFHRLESANSTSYRWHDPCQLGRGLGKYEEPRRLLTHISGAAPDEFTWNRASARCSGAGGALPRTLPEISSGIADSRLADHEALGGGTIVTACGSSLRRLRSRGASVEDLHLLLSRALSAHA